MSRVFKDKRDLPRHCGSQWEMGSHWDNNTGMCDITKKLCPTGGLVYNGICEGGYFGSKRDLVLELEHRYKNKED